MMHAPTFIPIHLPFSTMPDYLKSQVLWVESETAAVSGSHHPNCSVQPTASFPVPCLGCDSIPTPAERKKDGSTFKFNKAVSGIAKGGPEEESSYHARGDGKFQDGSNFQKQ